MYISVNILMFTITTTIQYKPKKENTSLTLQYFVCFLFQGWNFLKKPAGYKIQKTI